MNCVAEFGKQQQATEKSLQQTKKLLYKWIKNANRRVLEINKLMASIAHNV